MATTTRKTNATKTKTAAKATAATKVEDAAPVTAPAKATAAKPVKTVESKQIDIHQYIPVKNGSYGKLIYISKHTGETFLWEEFGDEQEMELQELKNAKSSSKAFFEKNWFMFDEEYSWVVDYLGLGQFYKNSIPIDRFDDLFALPADEIASSIEKLSSGQKTAVMIRAKQLIDAGSIDSNKTIAAIEKALSVELIER